MNKGTYAGRGVPYAKGCVNITLDGIGAALATGTRFDIVVPYDLEITEWRLISTVSGSVVIDLYRGLSDATASAPTSANSICGSDKPTLSSQTRARSQTLLRWDRRLNAADLLRINVDSSTTVSMVTLVLFYNILPMM